MGPDIRVSLNNFQHPWSWWLDGDLPREWQSSNLDEARVIRELDPDWPTQPRPIQIEPAPQLDRDVHEMEDGSTVFSTNSEVGGKKKKKNYA